MSIKCRGSSWGKKRFNGGLDEGSGLGLGLRGGLGLGLREGLGLGLHLGFEVQSSASMPSAAPARHQAK
jgi:hypothetical protein